MLFIAEPSPFSVCQITQSLTCSIMEKPHTGLDDCPRMLLPCFKNKMSVHFAQRFLPRIACRPRIDRNLSVFSESSSAQRFAFYNRFFPHSDPLSLSQISFHFPFPKQSLQSGVVSHKNCLIAVAVTEVEVARFRFLRIAISVQWGIFKKLKMALESKESKGNLFLILNS